jgi:hypothetical protein
MTSLSQSWSMDNFSTGLDGLLYVAHKIDQLYLTSFDALPY